MASHIYNSKLYRTRERGSKYEHKILPIKCKNVRKNFLTSVYLPYKKPFNNYLPF